MGDIEKELREFYSEMSCRAFLYSHVDCVRACGLWYARFHEGFDPSAFLSGTYFDKDSCADVMAGHGGLLRGFWLTCRVSGLERRRDVRQASPGDVGVVRHKRRHFGAIAYPKGRWGIKMTHRMVLTSECKPLVAFKVI